MRERTIQTLKKIEWRHCNRCKRDTRHSLIANLKRNEAEDFDENGCPTLIHEIVNAVWQCQGCESFVLESRYRNDCYQDGKWDAEFFPKPNHREIPPKVFSQLPAKLRAIYQEALIAFNSNARILSAVGLRGLVEGICKDKGISGNNLEKRIDGLTRILPPNIVNNLHSLRFMGNDATHELSAPKEHELRLGFEICEDLLNFLYELDYKTARLGRSRNRKPVPPAANPQDAAS